MESVIYKLDLENNKFLFGMVSQIDDLGIELEKHYKGELHEWTKINRILKYDIMSGNSIDCIFWILTFMLHYGYNNVRGGYWVLVEDYKNPPPVLMRFKKGKTKYNKCDKCHSYCHSSGRCSVVLDNCGDVIMS